MRFVVLLLSLAAAAHSQEFVTLETREGVTQTFLVPDAALAKPEAVALLFVGGGGGITLAGWMLKKPFRTEIE